MRIIRFEDSESVAKAQKEIDEARREIIIQLVTTTKAPDLKKLWNVVMSLIPQIYLLMK